MNMEQRIWHIATVATLFLGLVSLRIVYWQLIRGSDLQPVAVDLLSAAAHYDLRFEKGNRTTEEALELLRSGGQAPDLSALPRPVVQRTQDLLANITRGTIFDRNRRILADDRTDAQGDRIRFYTEPSLAQVIGYVSGLRTGITGLEMAYNDSLLGINRIDSQVEQVLHQPITGSNLVLTIDSEVQRVAAEALGERNGAVVVLDGQSGAVLGMVSYPRFDPNQMQNQSYIAGLLAQCSTEAGCVAPFLNRATQGMYPPGSTFKTVTLIGALDSGLVTPKTVFDFGKPVQGPNGSYYVYEVGGGVIPDPNHRENKLDLPMAYAKSANAAFARMGDEMGGETFVRYAQALGFSRPEDQAFNLGIEYTPSRLANNVEDIYTNDLLRAATAIGQGELLVNPLNMGMVVLSVLNRGDMPVPYFVESVLSPNGTTLSTRPGRQVMRGIMSRETARQVHDIMVTAVESGSGRAAKVAGATVGGKTGTAQLGGDLAPHAWFIGFAEKEGRSVAIAVLIENGGQGSAVAAPVFAQVAQAALNQASQPVEEIVPTPVPPTATPPPTATSEPPAREEQPGVEPQPTAAEAQVPTPTIAGVPAPEILHDPNKKDITAASASCPLTLEAPRGSGQFIWPSRYQALSGTDFKEGHPGIDLSAPHGSAVYAADTGLVIFAGWTGDLGYGNAILIDHGNGFQTLYAHLSQVSVPCGKVVDRGQLIGLSGNTGNSTGPHLHFEVRVPGGWINPLRVLPTP